MAWNLCWATSLGEKMKSSTEMRKLLSEPGVPTLDQHLLDSASTLRKAAAALHEFKFLCAGAREQNCAQYWLGRLEEAKLLQAQGQHEMAINLAKYISQNHQSSEVISDVYRLVGKWLAESRSSNSRTILEKYLKRAVMSAEDRNHTYNYVRSSR
ncbi:serine/threonine-protein kinase ATM-like isoform X2 [Rhododendron vialii]|uniref:serine/threonine-protein kinase ATM-like isoform X2 n=1 Tax=Rhododendron vialii TaxID=182163 RepID=UPI00265EFFB5|nr:serine/threonine-protein kinase ATM-like isoform X2 [Rhododendron vialii]